MTVARCATSHYHNNTDRVITIFMCNDAATAGIIDDSAVAAVLGKRISMHETLNMLLPLAGILLGAKAAAQLSHRFGLPAVFGELLLGLILAHSLLGWLARTETLQLLADIGVILLIFMAGLETDTVAMKAA